ncbi:ThuA domain-containing protein [Candidatus Bathyarchaeota archaeon]|nr:ThuA domain-containing protein [Candidatus Bathyarchaeota archaeon]RJS74408.1 MAG: ThuA domain-containing protein [Candidatus Bathyarchaeota archaeon]
MSRLLVLTHSAGFRHNYLTTAVEVLTRMGERSGLFDVYATEDCSEVTCDLLETCSAVLFMTSGELPMSERQREALIKFVRDGGGFVGVHNATDTFYKYPEYGRMIGGYFNGHPWTQEVYVIVEDNTHPSTRHLPQRFKVLEEVYTFKDWIRDRTHVLISLDNSSVDLSKGNREDNDYALAWCHSYGSGRVFYTAFGHFIKLWREEWFQKHLLGGILWVMRREE